ncbi:N-acetylmuramoyl-L-alanine amidase [Clostridium sp. Sa3CUN1]|uniref:N-acetylmuramoyl-L-alanine amidase n=1 Tax=Clostridium gallinarum TaxID=2762246 RepID=A0ABR8Q3N0_9CLOT|nr:N-acetylmuramoyl-L-alanine amidase [Clostridium gallinarum]MBD7915037.1 N-acetylmuramoyl-L-alanine amidase [Clostridium gallinarum]
MKKLKFIINIILIFILINSSNIIVKALKEEKHNNFTICIDAGHQKKGDNNLESVSPGASKKKARVSQGTSGICTQKAEYVVNLEASILLKEILLNKGYNVVMTRESHDVNISNAERAEIANKSKADMTIRIHCDSVKDSSKTGATILIPCSKDGNTKNIYEESNKFANILKDNLTEEGIKVNGVFERNDITGFNWSDVPVVILEMGFMSNYNEDKMLCDENYQKKLMNIVGESIDKYKEN